MDIEKNLNTISKKLSNYNAKLIPVIKNRTVDEVKEVYNCGFREFGENRLDDYFLHSEKFDDAVFHFIAPIQSRKIKVIFDQNKPNINTQICLDISKARDTFNWVPKNILSKGIEKTIEWYKENIDE